MALYSLIVLSTVKKLLTHWCVVSVCVFRGITAGDDRSWTLKWGNEENCKQLFSNVVVSLFLLYVNKISYRQHIRTLRRT